MVTLLWNYPITWYLQRTLECILYFPRNYLLGSSWILIMNFKCKINLNIKMESPNLSSFQASHGTKDCFVSYLILPIEAGSGISGSRGTQVSNHGYKLSLTLLILTVQVVYFPHIPTFPPISLTASTVR